MGGEPPTGERGISIHAPREGGDTEDELQFIEQKHFNPRPPRGGRRHGGTMQLCLDVISIHAPREGGDEPRHDYLTGGKNFNPRPPRGGRPSLWTPVSDPAEISIHAPREGGDWAAVRSASRDRVFQSTPPARGATTRTPRRAAQTWNFNPRPPRGGRQQRCTVLPADL